MIGAAQLLVLVRRFWRMVPVGLALLFYVQRNDARQAVATEKAERAADNDRADRRAAEQERGFAQRQASGTSMFADKLAAREPIIVYSTNTVREYPQTDAGRARCLGADRVRGLDAYLAALHNPHSTPAGGSAEAVRADADSAPAGR